jgi:hypothetical protein
LSHCVLPKTAKCELVENAVKMLGDLRFVKPVVGGFTAADWPKEAIPVEELAFISR